MALVSYATATARRFKFAFDSDTSSDKVLRLEVVAADASPASTGSREDCGHDLADSALAVSRKRQRVHEEHGTSADCPNTFSKKKQEVYERREESIEEETDEVDEKTKHKGTAGLIEIDNPNMVKPKSIKAKDVDVDRATDLSRLEREELEKQRSRAHYMRLQEEGKTEQARKDLDRLTSIREQREEAAKKREEEKADNGAKEDEETHTHGEGDVEKSASSTPILRVKHILVCSAILASESPFFFKLFTNGMKESEQKVVSIRVTEEELDAVEEIISFVYKGKFSRVEPDHLLKILIAADKFEISGAVTLCSELMLKAEMTTETALMYLDFSCSNSVAVAAFEPLKYASCQFLVNKFKEVLKFEEELLKMPLYGIRCIFRSSELLVPCEDYIFGFLLRWVSGQYPNLNERAVIFRSKLLPLVRFVHLSWECLIRFGKSTLMASKVETMTIVTSALVYKADNSRCPNSHWNYEQRVYLIKPLKVISFRPYPESVVYMDLSVDDCSRMFPAGHINSEVFTVSEHQFFIRAVCRQQPYSESHTLGLYVGIQKFGQTPVNVDIEFAVRQKPVGDFVAKFKFNTTFTSGAPLGYEDLFSSPWLQLIGDDSLFVIDGSLHLRVQLTIKQP